MGKTEASREGQELTLQNERPRLWQRLEFWLAVWGLFLAALGILAWRIQPAFEPPTANGFISGFFGGLIAAFAGGIAAVAAWSQLSSLAHSARSDARTNAARFALQLKNDFFTDRTRLLMELIGEDWLLYENAKNDGTPLPHPYFKVDEAKITASLLPDSQKERLTKCKTFSCYEIDDLLLGHFEDLYSLWKRNLLDLGLIYEGFSWYIEQCTDNSAIRRYLADEAEDSPDIWSGVMKLREALDHYEPDG